MFCFDFCFPKAAEAVSSKMTSWRYSEFRIWYEMRSLMQKNYAVSITEHQSPIVSAFSSFSTGYLFIDLSLLHYRKIRVTFCFRGRHEKSIKNKRIRWHHFVPYLLGTVLTNFTENHQIYIPNSAGHFGVDGFCFITSSQPPLSFRLP